MLNQNLTCPVSPRRRVRRGGELQDVDEEKLEEALHATQFGATHVLDLLGDVFQVEFVRQVSARLG